MKRWLIILVALVGAVFSIWRATQAMQPAPVPPPIQEPVRNPFPKGIAGAGIVEPASENVVIGVSEPGRVARVFVKAGQWVKKGDPLFQTDISALEAERISAAAAVESAGAELLRVQAFRRKEDEAGLRAKLAEARAAESEAKAAVEDARAAIAEAEHLEAEARATIAENEWALKDFDARRARVEGAARANAAPEEEADRARFAVRMASAKLDASKDRQRAAAARQAAVKARFDAAKARTDAAAAKVAQAQADLDTYLAGAWEPDMKKARAAVQEAQAKVERIEKEISRRTVTAPLDAMVISCDTKEGEYAMANAERAEDARIVLGNLSPLHVRVDVDEFDAQRFKPGLKATAFLKSGGDVPIPLEYVHLEPFIIPKRALTNSQREVVDTRVLQVVYRIAQEKPTVYVGQQLNVFINEE